MRLGGPKLLILTGSFLSDGRNCKIKGILTGSHRFIFTSTFIFTFFLSGKEISAYGRGGIGSSRRLLFSTKFRAPPLSASLSAGERGGYQELRQDRRNSAHCHTGNGPVRKCGRNFYTSLLLSTLSRTFARAQTLSRRTWLTATRRAVPGGPRAPTPRRVLTTTHHFVSRHRSARRGRAPLRALFCPVRGTRPSVVIQLPLKQDS